MNFNINKIILWLKNGTKRELTFEANKVNVITGDSNTGKTAILEIVDYCFFASKSKISESMINENILWYGLSIDINDKKYTIGRKSLNQGAVSDEYYFSSTGEIPDVITTNNSENSIKSLLETEFKINNKVVIPYNYGSNIIKAGSKISLRYFLMFNTISVNIIENDTGVFFDKQDEARYREALPRIFDMAVGIETIENVLKKEKKVELEEELKKLKNKQNRVSNKRDDFLLEQEEVIKQAKEYSLIEPNLDLANSILELQKLFSNLKVSVQEGNDREVLEKEYYLKERKIKNLKAFIVEYESFKKNLTNISDSLKPIQFLLENDNEIIKTSIFEVLMEAYSSELEEIRISNKVNTPINKQINDEIGKLEIELKTIKSQLSIQPEKIKNFENDKEKYIFLGEIKSKMELYILPSSSSKIISTDDIDTLQDKIDTLLITDISAKKELTIKLIEEIISEYIEVAGTALENYANYKPVFQYNNKSLLLRKPKTSYIENVGSSSNHMFLHLFFTLAMHEIAFQNTSPFIAPFIIIDQPSRPYYGDEGHSLENLEHTDESKITKAFELLDNFIETRRQNHGNFQMIVFEHVPKKIFKDLKNVHLVAEFRDGNALVPPNMI